MAFLVLFLVLMAILAVAVMRLTTNVSGKRRQGQEAELLWLLATTVRNQGNLVAELQTYASGATGPRREQLIELATRIEEGTPLNEISIPQGLLSPSAILEIQAGLTSGHLYEALRSVAIRHTREMAAESPVSKVEGALIYPAAVIITMTLIVGFIMYYIIPKFKKIFEDFGTELPGSTIMVIQVSDTVVNYWYLAAPLIYFLVAAAIAIERADYLGWRAVCQRMFGGWSVRVFTPDLLRCLSHSVAANQNLHAALTGILMTTKAPRLKRSLTGVSAALSQGAPCWEQLGRKGFLSNGEVALLGSAEQVGNLPWTLRAVADAIERRWSYRLHALADLFGPATILMLGAAVGIVVIGLFMPLVKLLNDLS